MPAPKSFWPALAGFLALSFTYTAVVARSEGSAVDGARTRWYQQKQRGLEALSGGATAEQQLHK
ncbi:hypothetical protein CC78DRAFT_531540 [Lojkania enalia]|uniref:Uncharacterized protein n=1 Tax=Lojkania enalia TaxID=147567 RepID=A0A9P4KHR6_9PLEO|nr:hypothetical protein CC78DRAFT_531540 [Didymosphaeria enalia]